MNGDETNKPENLIAAAIDAAEDIRDPLEGLVQRTATDPGAPFATGTLVRLAALKKDDRAAFEGLRAQLKGAGCRMTALDEALAEESGETGGRGPTQADILIALASAAELFHTPDGTGFADLDINGQVRLGRSVPRASAVGWRVASSRRRRARRVRRRCNQRST
jgi:hypothetical protein